MMFSQGFLELIFEVQNFVNAARLKSSLQLTPCRKEMSRWSQYSSMVFANSRTLRNSSVRNNLWCQGLFVEGLAEGFHSKREVPITINISSVLKLRVCVMMGGIDSNGQRISLHGLQTNLFEEQSFVELCLRVMTWNYAGYSCEVLAWFLWQP